jgi:hypothetical protein
MVSSGVAGNRVEFSTIVLNGKNGINISLATGQVAALTNDLMGKNTMSAIACFIGTCTSDGTIDLGTDIAPAHFVSPTIAPYDYHVTHGSVAIDAAVGGTLDHDFDGDVRPKGTARDVGADEAE